MTDDANDIPDAITGPQRILLQIFRLFVLPEVNLRQSKGTLPDPYSPRNVQVLFFEGKLPVVRLDKEINFTVRATEPRKFRDDEPISLAEIAPHINATELDIPDADAEHFTAFQLNEEWLMFFDFRRNKLKASKLVELAEQFCTSSKDALARQHYGPAIDNLFSACELTAKARLISSAGLSSGTQTHGKIRSHINLGGKLGNVDREFVDVFNKLSRNRDAARYEPSKEDTSTLIDENMISKVRAEIADLKSQMKRFSDL
jgi:HEPN domain